MNMSPTNIYMPQKQI